MSKVELIAGHIVALFHALFLSSCLGSIATEVSSRLFAYLITTTEVSIINGQPALVICIILNNQQMSTYILLGIDFIINLMFTGQVSALG